MLAGIPGDLGTEPSPEVEDGGPPKPDLVARPARRSPDELEKLDWSCPPPRPLQGSCPQFAGMESGGHPRGCGLAGRWNQAVFASLLLALMGKLRCGGTRSCLKVMGRAAELGWDLGDLVPSLPRPAVGPCRPLPTSLCPTGCVLDTEYNLGDDRRPPLVRVRKVCWPLTTSRSPQNPAGPFGGLRSRGDLEILPL